MIVDGASTDATGEIVAKFVGQGVDGFISEPDGGIADAFNKGVSRSTGDIIGLVNADDQLVEDTVAFVRRYFHEHPDVDVVHGDVLLYEGQRFLKQLKPAGCWWHPWRLVLYNHPATFVRRRVYEELGGFDESFRIAMDVEIFLRWNRAGKHIQYLERPLAIMQVGGVSGVQAKAGFDEYRRAAILHGYSPVLANIQYACKIILNTLVLLGRRYLPGI